MTLGNRVSKDRFAKYNKRQMLTAVALTLVLALVATVALTMSFGSSSVASAGELGQSSSAVIQDVSVSARLVDKVELDVNTSASEYKRQLQDANIDPNINPLDYGMPSGARLATRMTHTYEMDFIVDSVESWTLWSKVSVYITTSSWRHGFLNLSVTSDTTARIEKINHGISIANGGLIKVSSAKIQIKLRAGNHHGDYENSGYSIGHTATNFTDFKKTYDKNEDRPNGRIEGSNWEHSADIKWEFRLAVTDTNGVQNIFPYNKEKQIFKE
jgi:hypothetical protein